MEKIIDSFTFNGEFDILELRLEILYPHVDTFIIGEAPITFSGKPKPLYFEQQSKRFERFFNKIQYWVIDEYYQPWILQKMQREYDMMTTNQPFLMAFYQKESINIPLLKFDERDIVYSGDVDEIWIPQQVQDEPHKLEQLSYSMYLNNRTNEPWRGTAIARRKDYTDQGIGHIRQKTAKTLKNGGWHFSNMGGLDELRRKIQSYDHQEVNTKENHAMLEERHKKGTDFLGRPNFQNKIDDTEWPQYLKENKARFQHLCK